MNAGLAQKKQQTVASHSCDPAAMSSTELRAHIQSCRWLAGHAYSRWKATGKPSDLADHRAWLKARDEAGVALSRVIAAQEDSCFFSSDFAQAMGQPGWAGRVA